MTTAWLIERPSQGAGPLYWTHAGTWTHDSHAAFKFRTENDGIRRRLGIVRHDPTAFMARVTEHQWSGR